MKRNEKEMRVLVYAPAQVWEKELAAQLDAAIKEEGGK